MINTAPYLLRPKVGEHLNTITLNLTESMIEHYPLGQNRSQQILNAMRGYLTSFSNNDLIKTDKRQNITISKPEPELYNKIYKAVKSGLALSRSELFREAIRWDMQRKTKEKRERLEMDQNDGVVRIPIEKSEKIYKIIGIA